MSVKHLLPTLLLLAGLHTRGQDSSYQHILAEKHDSTRIVRLAEYAYSFINTDRPRALRLYGELLALSKKVKDPYWTGMALFNMGNIHAREAKDSLALVLYRQAKTQLEKTDRADKIASCYINIGAISGRMGKIDEQVNAALTAIRILEPTPHKNLLVHSYNSMGIVFFNLDDYHRGLSYFRKSLSLGREIRDSSTIISSYLGITNCLSSLQQYDEALHHAREALRIAEATQNHYSLCESHMAFTELYRKQGRGAEIIPHAKKILHHARAMKEVQYQLIGLMALADGEGLMGNPASQVRYLKEALKIGESSKTVIQLDDIYKGLAEANEKLRNYREALGYHQLYVLHRDSANNQKTRQQAAELEVKYRITQKEKELADQALQLEQNKLLMERNKKFTLISIGSAIIVLLLSGLGYLYYRNRKNNLARELASVQKDREIQLLQAVMQGEEKERSRVARDLHDGVAGILAAAKMHFSCMGEDYKSAENAAAFRQGLGLLEEATVEIRKTSHNLMPEILLQYGLDHAIRRYCNNINNRRGIRVVYGCLGKLLRYNGNFELSVYRIVQELLNNIIKHSQATQALVQVSQQDNLLSITIEDNGVGMGESEVKDGVGLQNLASRVKAINGKIELDSITGQGLSVFLEFDTRGMEQKGGGIHELPVLKS